MTFGELAVGDKFVSAVTGENSQACQKKSSTSAYDLIGGEDGELVLAGKSVITQFSKKAPVIKIEA